MNGFAVVRNFAKNGIPVAIVFLTVHDDEAMFEAALELDVRGYLLKDCTDAEMVKCVSAVCIGSALHEPRR